MAIKDIETCITQLIDCIRNDSAYQTYKKFEDELSTDPQLQERIDEFRKARYEIFQKEDWYDEIDKVDEDFADLKRRPEVNAYLDAELDVCRMLREVQVQMIGSLDINTPII